MKGRLVKGLDQRCGECPIIDYCDEPYSDICICTDYRFKDEPLIEVLEVLKVVGDRYVGETLLDESYRILKESREYRSMTSDRDNKVEVYLVVALEMNQVFIGGNYEETPYPMAVFKTREDAESFISKQDRLDNISGYSIETIDMYI